LTHKKSNHQPASITRKSNSASPEIIWGLGGHEEDHQLHHDCWTGRVGEREEEEVVMKRVRVVYRNQR